MGKVGLAPKVASRLLRPTPTAIVTSVDENGEINAAPISYLMMVSYDPATVAMVITNVRHTYENIHRTGEFVMNFPTVEILKELWLLGRPYVCFPKRNKFIVCGLTAMEAEKVKPPRIKECAAHIECRVEREIMFPEGEETCTLFIAKVLACSADEGVLTRNFQYDLKKARFLHHYGCNVFGTTQEPIYAGIQRELTVDETFKYISPKKEPRK